MQSIFWLPRTMARFNSTWPYRVLGCVKETVYCTKPEWPRELRWENGLPQSSQQLSSCSSVSTGPWTCRWQFYTSAPHSLIRQVPVLTRIMVPFIKISLFDSLIISRHSARTSCVRRNSNFVIRKDLQNGTLINSASVCINRVFQEERSIFWEVILSAIVRKKVHTNMCLFWMLTEIHLFESTNTNHCER